MRRGLPWGYLAWLVSASFAACNHAPASTLSNPDLSTALSGATSIVASENPSRCSKENSGCTFHILGGDTRDTVFFDPEADRFLKGPTTAVQIGTGAHTMPIYSGIFRGSYLTHVGGAVWSNYKMVFNPASGVFSTPLANTLNITTGAFSILLDDGPNQSKHVIFTGMGGLAISYFTPATSTFSAGVIPPVNIGSGSQAILIHSGTLNDRYLIINGLAQNTTSVYDPLTASITAGPTMPAVAGAGSNYFQIDSGVHAGKYLIIAGNSSTNTALYDPALNSFSAGPALVGATGALVKIRITSGPYGGRVLALQDNASALYDPLSNTFSAGPALPFWLGAGAHAFEIRAGKNNGRHMIIAGGDSNKTILFDPGAFTLTSGNDLDTKPISTGANSIAITRGKNAGKYLLLHGNNSNKTSIYDPHKKSWTPGALLPFAISHACAALIDKGARDGKYLLLVAGPNTIMYDQVAESFTSGETFGGGAYLSLQPTAGSQAHRLLVLLNGTTSTRIFDPITDLVTSGANLPSSLEDNSLAMRISSGSNAGKYLIVRGSTYNNTWIYDPSVNTFAVGPNLNQPVQPGGGGAFEIPYGPQAGKILILTWSDNTSLYNPATGTMSAGPLLTTGRSAGAFVLPLIVGPNAGKVLVVLGLTAQTNLYDPMTNSFTMGPNLTGPVNNGAHPLRPHPSGGPAETLIVHGNNSVKTSIYDPFSNTMSAGPDIGYLANAGVGAHSFSP